MDNIEKFISIADAESVLQNQIDCNREIFNEANDKIMALLSNKLPSEEFSILKLKIEKDLEIQILKSHIQGLKTLLNYVYLSSKI